MFEVGKQYISTETKVIYECLAVHGSTSWMKRVDAGGIGSLWEGVHNYSMMKEYTPPVIVERFMNIYPPFCSCTSHTYATADGAKAAASVDAIGLAKYTWTDRNITSITICD